jgi:hypothetical protein
MRNIFKAAIVAFGALGALAGTASAQPYDQDYPDDGYYGDPAYGPPPDAQAAYGDPYAYDQAYADPYFDPTYGYCDPYYGCPDDFYDLPLYYGDVYYDGSWLTGPFYYRDYGGRRQFWTHGGWHDGRYRGGHFGRALGRDFYTRHGFSGRNFNRAGNWGGQNYSRRAYNGGFNGGNFNRGFSGRSSFQAQPQTRQNFGFRGRGNWGGWNRQSFQSGGNRFQGQAQVQAQPRQSFQGGGGHNWSGGGGGHNWNGGGGGHGGGGGGHNWGGGGGHGGGHGHR